MIAKLREVFAGMTAAPWTETKPGSNADGWPTSTAVCAVARGQNAYAEAARGVFPAADLTGIVALVNHKAAMLDALELAHVLVFGPPENAQAARVALRCALIKLEEIR